jgi:hypothetical protein
MKCALILLKKAVILTELYPEFRKITDPQSYNCELRSVTSTPAKEAATSARTIMQARGLSLRVCND